MRVIRSLVLAVSLLTFGGAPALAEKAGDPGTNVEMPFLMAPMSKDGKLLGYAYISSKLVASSSGAALEVREKVAIIQDAFVRDVNAAPVALLSDPTKVDTKLLAARLVADAKRVVGATKVVQIVFGDGKSDTGIQFSPLHPALTAVPPDDVAANQPPPAKPAAAPAPANQ